MKELTKITERTIHEFIRGVIYDLMKMHNVKFVMHLQEKPSLALLECKDRSLQNKFNKRKLRLMPK